MTNYNKQPLSIPEQAQLLLTRGLLCEDTARLENYLASIGYYRLSAYWLPFEQSSSDSSRNHQFLPHTHFEKILTLYIAFAGYGSD
jgi:abortive infection bacteriophage resistance protein